MPYPNSALPAWQLAVIAVVAAGALAVWLVAVFLAARPSGRADEAALASPSESAAAGTEQPAVADKPQPTRRTESRKAA